MPAAHPSLTTTANKANGAATVAGSGFVICDPISGPKGSPLDVRVMSGDWKNNIVYTNDANGQSQASTGGLSTGIGLSESDIIGTVFGNLTVTAPQAIFRAGFNDNDIPGEVPTYAAGGPPPVVASSAINSTRMYIGGGKCTANVNGIAPPVPYTAGVAVVGWGNGGSRDGGAGPAFTGFPMKMVTATGSVAVGAAVEAGWTNRSSRTIVTGESVFGSATAPLTAPS